MNDNKLQEARKRAEAAMSVDPGMVLRAAVPAWCKARQLAQDVLALLADLEEAKQRRR